MFDIELKVLTSGHEVRTFKYGKDEFFCLNDISKPGTLMATNVIQGFLRTNSFKSLKKGNIEVVKTFLKNPERGTWINMRFVDQVLDLFLEHLSKLNSIRYSRRKVKKLVSNEI